MISDELRELGAELAARREPYVTATVVRVEHPTSAAPGDVALVRADGTLAGFVGGVCAQHSVRLYSLETIARGEPLLLRIMPDPDEQDPDNAPIQDGSELERAEGSVTVRNPCLSGGAIEIFLEPQLPAPRVLAAGDSPIVDRLRAIGPEVGLEVVTGELHPAPGDLALVVAAHGRDELGLLRAALEVGLPYVGLVASRRRGAGVLAELGTEGVADDLLARIDTPAGLEIGASTAGEVALSILARIVEVRRASSPGTGPAGPAPDTSPHTAVDPVCGMTVIVDDQTPSVTRGDETFYFCCEGCRSTFEREAT